MTTEQKLNEITQDIRENCTVCGELLYVAPIFDVYIQEELEAIIDYRKISQDDINFLTLLNISEDNKSLIDLADKIISIHENQNEL